MNDCFHVCTNGLEKNLWFYDEDDYIAGMNSIPVCAINCGITVLCFTLMSNHVHFVIRGREMDCIRFIWEYKRLRSRQLTIRYEGRHSISGSGGYVGKIPTVEKMRTVLAYVMRNPLGAGLAFMPESYRWGSANLYFTERKSLTAGLTRLGEMSVRKRRRIFRTRIDLPEDFLVQDGKMIFPGSYVDYRAVEQIYRGPKQLLYFLSSAKDMEEEMETGILAKVGHGDAELSASLDAVCSEKFSGKIYLQLTIEERFRLAKELRRRYGSGPKQLSRVLSLDYKVLKSML